LKIRNENFYSHNEKTVKHKIIGMMNHEKLNQYQEFILIVLENKSEIIKFNLKNNLDNINPSHNIRFKITDLTPTG